MGKFAWVTLATNDSYAMGALVLAHSLRRVNTAHQLVVLITPGVTEAMKTQLSAVFNVVKLVDVLDSRDTDNLALLARPELGITFTKLHCWKLTEYEKCVFLDADTLVLQNSDELFEREELSAAPDAGWPDCFNSGVFVYKPSQQTFQALIEFALIHGSFDGGDQGLLNLFFSDWATKDIQKHLPFVYNMCSTATYSYLPAFKQFGAGLKIIHFIGTAKPWLQPFNTETGLVSVSGESQHLVQFVQLWWDIFCAHVHPSLSTEMAGLAGALATVTLGAPLTVEQRALEEHLRRQGWEQGNIDYMGKDSFANIWQKICETLGTAAHATPAAPPEDAPAPVAPVAAPVYVSSVEISPSGQIDKTPPQANYAPVSAITPTVEASDIKDATIAPLSETATVAPEPKPSVTEVVPTEASVTPSATLGTSTPTPQIASEPPAVQQPVTPAESAVKTETPTMTASEAPAIPAVPPKEALPTPPPTEVPVAAPAAPAVPTTPTTTPSEAPVATTPISIPAEVPVPTPPAPTPTPIKEPAPITPTPIPTEVPAPVTPTTAPITPTPTPAETPVPVTPAPTQTKEPSPTTPIPIPTDVPVPVTPTTAPVTPTPAEAPVPTTPAPTTPIPTPTDVPAPVIPITPTPIPLEAPAPTPIPTTVPVSTPAPSEAPVSTPTPTETPVSSSATPAAAQTPASAQSAPVPTETAPLPTPPVSPPSVEPSAPVPAELPGIVPTPSSESTAPPAKADPAQPQTPTVIEPTPPTSPEVAEALQLTKLQVEATVPGTPPVGGSAQPSLEGAAATEPPVPPKRKGGSKAPQDSKNQKGGKPSKGKK